ncbi:MAG: type I-E CRISPR-associated protein Cas5/CasD [Leptonema sp. (in: Bacteria)]|nr:type I-E CRISPR-associated protein Cas5/CasD [Leptonema sp. (in: bacteria)]
MSQYLVFHIHGPLFAAGDIAVGEYRPSLGHPTKSGLMGLIAGSMGIDRTDHKKNQLLNEKIKIGILVLNSGYLLRDYHTSMVPALSKTPFLTRRNELLAEKLTTILSTRDYRQDSLFRIVLSSKDVDLLASIKAALITPIYAPYLGRKSCPPALPFAPTIVNAESMIEALKVVKCSFTEEILFLIQKNKKSTLQAFLEEKPKGIDITEFKRHDRLIDRKRWQFGERIECLVNLEASSVL